MTQKSSINVKSIIEESELSDFEKQVVNLAAAGPTRYDSAATTISQILIARRLDEASRALAQFDSNLQSQITAMNEAQEKFQRDASKISNSLALATWVLAAVTLALFVATGLSVWAQWPSNATQQQQEVKANG